MAVGGFNELLATMASQDFFTGVLPFVASYVIFYAIMVRLPIWGGSNEGVDAERFSALLAVVFAFFVARFIVLNPWYQTFFVTYVGKLTVGVIGILGLMVLLTMVGWETDIFAKPALAIVMIAIAGAAFTSAGGFGPPLTEGLLESFNLSQATNLLLDTGLIWILVIGGVLWYTTGDDNGNDEGHWLFNPVQMLTEEQRDQLD